jgi:hypothetical protein
VAEVAEPKATAAPSEPGKTAVLVFSKTPGAVVMQDGKTIELPETFQVDEDTKLALEVTAEGFTSKTIELDGSETKVSVELDPLRPTPGTAIRRRITKPAPKGKSGSDVVEPWD